MILDHMGNAYRYAAAHPLFAKAFEVLRREDLLSLPAGRHEVDGERVYLVVVKADGAGRPSVPLEAHRKYIDIQCVLSGVDEMGWRPLCQCAGGKGFDPDKDLEFFADSPAGWFSVRPGHFAVFFPSDAHAPGCGAGPVHKIVVKALA
jgi:biofilm protein TabA